MSGGAVAWFEDDHGGLDRPSGGVEVEAHVDSGPALPQTLAFQPFIASTTRFGPSSR
jgi:hypothetical protein